MSSEASAATTPSRTASSAAALRPTPLGSPVLPEVKLSVCVPGGSSTGAASSFTRASASSPRCQAPQGRPTAAWGRIRASAPAARKACWRCAALKNSGKGR
jgi:hypothetical protein